MAFKILVLVCLIAATNAGIIAPAATSYSSSSISHNTGISYAAPALKIATPIHTVAHVAPIAHVSHVAPVAIAAPLHKTIIAEDHYAPAHYNFEYSVHDPHTGDMKSQKEVREGDVVHGSYSLVEPDGSKRIVEYTADEHNGFNAVVHREPAAHPVAVKAIAPIIKTISAAPVLKYAPIAHVAPVVKTIAPVVKYTTPVLSSIAHVAPVAHVAHVAPAATSYSSSSISHASPAIAHYIH